MKKILFLLMALITGVIADAAQQESYDYFRHVKTYGMEVNSIYRDPLTGIVWLGTSQGLLRYGSSPLEQALSVYPENLNQSIKSVTGLNNGLLLIRTNSMRYISYDPISNRIVNDNFADYFAKIGIDGAKPHSSEIVVDNGDLWIYTGKNLYINPRNNDGTASLKAVADDKILYVHINESQFYILTAKKLSLYDKKTAHLIKRLDWNFPADIRDLRMVQDHNGDIWIGNENLYRYDIRNGICTEIARNLSVTDMTVSNNGDVYVATNTQGIVAYNANTKSLKSITFDAYDINKLKSNRLRTIFIDDDNNLWVSYSKQGLSISNSSLSICNVRHIESLQRQNKTDDIVSLMYDRDGHLWLGTDGNGLYKEPDSNNKSYIPDIFSHGKNYDTSVTATYIDSSGRYWIGVYRKGVLCNDNGKWRLFLEDSSPYSIVEDMYGNIYIGTLGNGLYCLSPDNDYTPVELDLRGRKYVPHLSCNRGSIIYATTSAGLGIIDAATKKIEILDGNRRMTQRFSTIDLQSVFIDSRGLLWLIGAGSQGSLDIFDITKDSIIRVPTHTVANISSLIEDDNKNIWIASDDGIINIVVGYDAGKDMYSFRNYVYNPRSNDDEFRHFNSRAAAKSPDGNLAFGSTNGYVIINPLAYSSYQGSSPHRIYLQSLKINSNLIKPGVEYDGRIILDKDIAATDHISLKSDENNLSFLVNSQDYGSPFESRYYYQLDGLSANWIPVENHTIDLTNLAVGSYTLSICGQNPDGTMTLPLTRLDLRVNAPWYLSAWAYIIYLIIGVAIIAIIIYYLSERKSQKLRLEQAEKEIQRQSQINEMKLRFFTNISHDFRTPLSLIITPLEVYLNDKEKNPDVKFFTPIYRNAVRLLNLINQILDFRKLEVYGETLNLSNGDIVSFVKEVCASFTMFAEDNNVQLSISSSKPALNMAFDMDKLSKILMNLLSNAFKHTPQGGKVFVTITSENNDTVQISVIDCGCGIPDKDKDKIFERFYQNKCDNAANMGCGVGLHIVREYVALHNGSIRVTDNNPTGAIFTISLPIVHTDVHSEQPHTAPAAIEESEIDGKNTLPDSKHTIMIVEDNQEFLDFLHQSLSEDYNVLKASNGEEALAILNDTSSVDIVISDVMMDKMDGLELCRRIKTDLQFSHIPLILLTAKSMVEDEIQGFEVGADDYITKPFNLSVLKLRIQNILKSRDRYRSIFKTKADINPSEVTITSLDEQFIAKALATVEDNIANTDFSVEDLSTALGMHRAHLYRKLSGITGKSPVEFIRLIRLKRAKQYLEKSQMYISEIAYAVGFNSPKLFAKYFKDEFGMSPRDYQNKHSA